MKVYRGQTLAPSLIWQSMARPEDSRNIKMTRGETIFTKKIISFENLSQ